MQHKFKHINMAREIKETPILEGKDAERFLKRMKTPSKPSPEIAARRKQAWELVQKMKAN